MTKKQFINSIYISIACQLDYLYNLNSELVDWAVNSKYAQELLWTWYKFHGLQVLNDKLLDTYMNSLIRRDVGKSIELMLLIKEEA